MAENIYLNRQYIESHSEEVLGNNFYFWALAVKAGIRILWVDICKVFSCSRVNDFMKCLKKSIPQDCTEHIHSSLWIHVIYFLFLELTTYTSTKFMNISNQLPNQ